LNISKAISSSDVNFSLDFPWLANQKIERSTVTLAAEPDKDTECWSLQRNSTRITFDFGFAQLSTCIVTSPKRNAE
jgi:hypothetical protein